MSTVLHPRNPHQGRYDLDALSNTCPELKLYLRPNPKGDNTVDFSDENAVLCLNKALLAHYYHVAHWQIPAGYLCPPIPGRADYIHYSADLLAECNQGLWPTGKRVNVLDIGTGANCIYPIIGSQSYGWQFVGTDIDAVAIKTAQLIVKSNTCLAKHIKLVHQKDSELMFKGMIKGNDRFDLTICNPPFHASMAEAKAGSQRKWTNLNKSPVKQAGGAKLNFGGQQTELWCPGGELSFLERMAKESVAFAEQVCWFTSLVSKKENVLPLKSLIAHLGAKQCKVVNMSQGQKISRLIVWSFLSQTEQQQWAAERWR
jgi:23S rRNA (adenine1618-N6)-methyltransferase